MSRFRPSYRAPTWRQLVLVALLAGLMPVGGCSRPTTPPNVLILMVDTLRADYLGYAGFEGDISPNLDALARESVVFDRAVAQAPWTAPSVASLFTSLQPQVHCLNYGDDRFCEREEVGPESGFGVLPEEARTLAEVFQDAGYATKAIMGNWVLKSKFGFGQGFESFDEPSGVERHLPTDDVIVQAALGWAGQRDPSRPFLLYLHFMDVHAPYRVEEEHFRALADSPSLGEEMQIGEAEASVRPEHLDVWIPWPRIGSRDSLRAWKAAYAAGVRRFDRKIGEMLRRMEDSGLLDNTIVVFTSDHGEEFLEHGGWEHARTYYNELALVPLTIRLPDRAGAGRRVAAPVSLIDLMPTLMRQAGLEGGGLRMQGRDLSGLLTDGAGDDARLAFTSASPQIERGVACQDARYKFILDPAAESIELYDLEQDPGEQNDLVEELPELAEDYRRRSERHLDELEELGSFRPVGAALDDRDIEALRSLGYID